MPNLKPAGIHPDGVTTAARVLRSASPYVQLDVRRRRTAPNSSGMSHVETVALDGWSEGSHGDPMYKLVLVAGGCIDVEGPGGGWLVPRNHLIMIPMGRPFNFRASKGTVVLLAHLRPQECHWVRTGCWVNAAADIARIMVSYPLRRSAPAAQDTEATRMFLSTLATVCLEWFENRRMLHIPAAGSDMIRRVLSYVGHHIADANLQDACDTAGTTPRTLQRRCEEELLFSWRELLREVRTMRAIELLAQADMTIGEVAEEVGFRSLSAFTTAFTARVGVQPSIYARELARPPPTD